MHAAEEAVQLHGGIGMTWEHPAHLFLKRAKADEIALGTPGRHRTRLAGLVDLPGPVAVTQRRAQRRIGELWPDVRPDAARRLMLSGAARPSPNAASTPRRRGTSPTAPG